MFLSQRFKPLFYLKSLAVTRTPLQTSKPHPFPSTQAHLPKHISISSQQHHAFTVFYLINNCGFSQETALKTSKFVQFENAQKPDSVIAFFRTNGFSNSQINSIVRRAPNVLKCDPHKRVSPKFQFFLSKGASSSDIAELVNRSPRILYASLDNSIIPSYELVRRFLKSDEKTMRCILACRHFFGNDRLVRNARLLMDEGVTDSSIYYLFRRRPSIMLCSDMKEALDEIKEMGFDPSKLKFVIALRAKRVVPKSGWEAKVDAFKRRGWSEELILETFRKQPRFMLLSRDKIDRLMRFWVMQLGWDSLALARGPMIFGYSMEKRVIPRARVVQYLLEKGLRGKCASLLTPFAVSDKAFLEKYVICFKGETCEQLLKLYREKMSVQGKKEDGAASACSGYHVVNSS